MYFANVTLRQFPYLEAENHTKMAELPRKLAGWEVCQGLGIPNAIGIRMNGSKTSLLRKDKSRRWSSEVLKVFQGCDEKGEGESLT